MFRLGETAVCSDGDDKQAVLYVGLGSSLPEESHAAAL